MKMLLVEWFTLVLLVAYGAAHPLQSKGYATAKHALIIGCDGFGIHVITMCQYAMD